MSDDNNIFSYDKRFDFDPTDEDIVFDPLELVEEALQSDLDPGVFDEVDDRDMPKAPNFVEFMLGKQFVGLPRLFPRQIEICTNLLGQFCPRCTNPAFLERREDRIYMSVEVNSPLSEIWDNVEFLKFGICSKCKAKRPELIASGELMHHTELAGCAGMRASKSTMTAMLAAYQNHKYLSIPSPARYFGLLPKQALHMTFVALTATQAHDTLWTAFKDLVEAAPWYQQYHEFLDAEGKRLGTKLYDWSIQFFRYRLKSLVGSYMGANIRTIRGRTRYFTAIDECGWFDMEAETNKVRENAYETHKALEKSLRTVRSAAFKLRQNGEVDPLDGLDCNVSSPSAINDPIMTFIKEAAEDSKKYAFHFASWEINPDITLESLKDEMVDRSSFERDYGATPPLGVSQFISNDRIFEKAQRGEPQKLARWCKMVNEDFDGDKSLYLDVECLPEKNRPRAIGVDTGFSNNSFSVVVCSFDRVERTVDVDLALELPPERDLESGTVTPINFPLMYEKCIVPLVKNLNVAYVLYDRWQSIDQIMRLKNEEEVRAEQLSLKYADFLRIRSKLLDGGFTLPQAEMTVRDVRMSRQKMDDVIRGKPIISLIMQSLTVREVGTKIAKPLNGNDDIFRALSLCVARITDPEYTAEFEAYGGAVRGRQGGALGVYRSNKSAHPMTHTRSGVRRGFRS